MLLPSSSTHHCKSAHTTQEALLKYDFQDPKVDGQFYLNVSQKCHAIHDRSLKIQAPKNYLLRLRSTKAKLKLENLSLNNNQ